MKQLVIIGAGTAGTMMANHLKAKLQPNEWRITIVDERTQHYYQPGFLFIPFGKYKPQDVVKPIKEFIPKGIRFINKKISQIHAQSNIVELQNGGKISYDVLIAATGSKIAPEEVQGMLGPLWQKSIFDFYTFDGAVALSNKLSNWNGGNLVVHITEMPIKCPVAPLEFAFLADSFFTAKGIRNKVNITYVTPLSGAFTKPRSTKKLEHLLKEKNIAIEPDFAIAEIDNENKIIVDYSGRKIPFDLLVTVPTNKGDELIARSALGDELNFIPTQKETLQSKHYQNIFVIGDATDIPASKAGSVAHFEAEILTENILHFINNRPLSASFDGHSNCFIETGGGKALLIDFNYSHEPVEGTFPVAGIGPLKLLNESRLNHWGKLAFRWVYWHMLIKGISIPFVKARMQTAGKKF